MTTSGSTTTPPPTPAFGYVGMVYDYSTGLNLTLYRAYDPQLRRWLSRDPVGFAGGINVYGYVGGDPVNYGDPYGLWTLAIGGTVNIDLWIINFSYSGGVAIDNSGNLGTYYYPGIGLSAGVGGAGGLSVSVSNANTICDLGGPFVNGSFGAGAGPDLSGDLFFGPSPGGQVVGGGLTLGAGVGAGGSESVTYTVVHPLIRLW